MKLLARVVNGTGFIHALCSFDVTYPFRLEKSSVIYQASEVVSILLVAASIPTSVLNFLMILTIFVRRRLYEKTYYKALAIMALTDFLTGAVAMPYFAKCFYYILSPSAEAEEVCLQMKIASTMSYILSGLSFNTVMFISIERYFKICHALTYHHIFKQRHALQIFSILILPTIASSTVPFTIASLITGVEITIYVLVIPVLFYKIFATVRKSRRSVADDRSMNAKEWKIAKNFIVIVVFLALFYLPYALSRNIMDGAGTPSMDEYIISTTTFCVVILNSLFNPVIYIWQDTSLRRELFSLKNHCEFPSARVQHL